MGCLFSFVGVKDSIFTIEFRLDVFAEAVITQPHPVTFCIYLMASVAENVVNHSGLDHWFTPLVWTLMFESVLLKKVMLCAPKNTRDKAWEPITPQTFRKIEWVGMMHTEKPLRNLLFLKFLPFRAGVAVHDAHHRYSNYPKNAKNFGENFWLWDWAFGTLGKVGSSKPSKLWSGVKPLHRPTVLRPKWWKKVGEMITAESHGPNVFTKNCILKEVKLAVNQ